MRWRCSREIRLVPAGSSSSSSLVVEVRVVVFLFDLFDLFVVLGLLPGSDRPGPVLLGAPALPLEARGLALLVGALHRVAHDAASGTDRAPPAIPRADGPQRASPRSRGRRSAPPAGS